MTDATTAEVLHLKSEDISFPANTQRRAGGVASNQRLIHPGISTTLASGVAYYDGCSFEVAMKYDETIIVLDGTFRIRTGENYSRVIEATTGDVIWLPKGARTRWEGEKAKIFYAAYPVDWRTRNEVTAVINAATKHFHDEQSPEELVTTSRVENWFASEVEAFLEHVIAESGNRKLSVAGVRMPPNWFAAIGASTAVPVTMTDIEFDTIEVVFRRA